MRRNSERTGFASGNRLTKHGETRCASPTSALSDPLEGAGDRKHRCGDFHTTEYGIVCRDKKIARQRQLETAAEGDPVHHRYCRYLQRLNGAIRSVHVRDKRAEPVDVPSRPFPDFAPEAEMRPFSPDNKYANVAFAGLVHRD